MADSSYNAFNHRIGDTKPIFINVDSAQVVKVGDLVWLNTDDARALSDYTWDTSLAVTNPQLKTRILGVALSESPSGTTGKIRIGTAGVYEFTCAAATFEPGDLVGLVKQTGNYIENRKVVGVTDPRLAIGRVYKQYASNTTTVWVEIFPVASGNGAGIPRLEHIVITGNGLLTAAADFVTGFTFGRRVRVVEWVSNVNVALSANETTVTFEKDTVDMTETLVIAASAPIGARDSTAVTTLAEGLFEADSVLDVESDGAPTTGYATITALCYEIGENS